MIRYFAAHPTAANILMLAIVALGLAALPGLNKESFPIINLYKLQVSVAYPGASATDVEDALCNRLEDATDGISFMKEQACEALDNRAVLTLEMQEQGDMQLFVDDVKTAMDGIQDFPEEAEDPIIKILGRTSPVISVALTADKLTGSELKALAEHYRDRLLALPTIPIVNIDGFSTHELSVLLRKDALLQYSLSVQDVADLIRQQAVDLPAGVLESRQTSYQIRFENARRTAEELADLVILNNDKGGEIRLGDIARIEDRFDRQEERIEINGKPAAILQVNKNTIDDSLTVLDAVTKFVEEENARLPESTRLTLTQDRASIVKDRLKLLGSNGWQGLLLATLALFLFFNWRYTIWVALGLPISFLGGLAIMSSLGYSINMISLVALLMSIGILMDDAIVLSESIDHEYRKGKSPLQSAIDGTSRVVPGVLASFLTSVLLFGSLLFMKGDLGQIMGVLPVVLLAVLSISLLEAFLVLPRHLKHSLEHFHHREQPKWRQRFEAGFGRLRERVGKIAESAIRYRYLTVGITFAMLVLSIGLLTTGILKFKAFPDLEGDSLEARILLPQGTPLATTESVVQQLLKGLDETRSVLEERETEPLIQNVQVAYSENKDASEVGAHLATISIDLLGTEKRHSTLAEFIPLWREKSGDIPDVISIQYKEPVVGPAGRAIEIRISGDDLTRLSKASWELQNWLRGYAGVYNLLDDLRPGKPQFSVQLKPGALASGINSQTVAAQLRAAYQGIKVSDIYQGREAYEINVKLDSPLPQALNDFDDLEIFPASGQSIPLSSLATIKEERDFARIGHVDHQRVVNIFGDIDAAIANTSEVLKDTKKRFFPTLKERYPDLKIALKGEVESGAETNRSILTGFALGLLGVFLLLSLQFKNYREPLIVMLNIPFALIGAIWGHMIMGLDFTMPSMIGFVALAGVVVNDSILLVVFVKHHVSEGLSLHAAASQAVRDRFRAIFLTSATTVAGMTPLLFETSMQAQVLVPLVTSLVFGMLTSTLLIMIVLPSLYAIMEDVGFVELQPETA
ncbi:MAG TPA: efflux RND transporter permease subunit [Chromatiales bacterium]|nr:efflux RND transporter permease subunit [Thiotrichales bacterium]HIP69078.1 efflux RND transporter permease subunit [Chromatiales bacterium]